MKYRTRITPPIPIVNTLEKEYQKGKDDLNEIIDNKISISDNQIVDISQQTVKVENAKSKTKLIESNKTLPEYKIERVEILSGVFSQGKVYVTLDGKSSGSSQLALCKKIRNSYREFSNIVICLYADNLSGRELAKGNNEIVGIEEQKRYWLAMYTYNVVEGEYFDNNPSGYLGIN